MNQRQTASPAKLRPLEQLYAHAFLASLAFSMALSLYSRKGVIASDIAVMHPSTNKHDSRCMLNSTRIHVPHLAQFVDRRQKLFTHRSQTFSRAPNFFCRTVSSIFRNFPPVPKKV